MIDQANDFINRRFQIFVFSGLYCLANLMQCFQPRVFVGRGVAQADTCTDFIFGSVAGALHRLLHRFQPAQYLHLHHQDGLQHFLCVVFSHVVFLLLVDGVASTTLAGGGVAFYSCGVAYEPD